MTKTKYNIEDLKGKVFGRLTIIEAERKLINNKTRIVCKCLCSCGKIKYPNYDSLKSGVKSCGCFHSAGGPTTHGYTRGKNVRSEYTTWSNIRNRCYKLNNNGYKDYGLKGIKVCDRWINSFENFIEDMGNKPTPKHSIERKNSKGNYEKENCYWATNREQSRNKSNNHYIEYNGENLILNDWESKTGIKATTIFNRIKNLKWSIEDSLTIKPKKNASTSKSDK